MDRRWRQLSTVQNVKTETYIDLSKASYPVRAAQYPTSTMIPWLTINPRVTQLRALLPQETKCQPERRTAGRVRCVVGGGGGHHEAFKIIRRHQY